MAIDGQQDWYLRNMDLRGQVVADVGANVGVLSQFFWDHGDARTRVVSIEPLPQALEQLRARVSAAGDPRWRVEACACSDRAGTVWLEPGHTQEHGWNSVVRAPGAGSGGAAPGWIEVPCRRLAEIVPDATIVKLDVEGHEYPILDDALATLPDVHTWAIELHMVESRPLPRVLEALADRGLQLFAAGRRPGSIDRRWDDVPIPTSLGWERIPVAERRPDGTIFKMLHLVARRGKPGDVA